MTVDRTSCMFKLFQVVLAKVVLLQLPPKDDVPPVFSTAASVNFQVIRETGDFWTELKLH